MLCFKYILSQLFLVFYFLKPVKYWYKHYSLIHVFVFCVQKHEVVLLAYYLIVSGGKPCADVPSSCDIITNQFHPICQDNHVSYDICPKACGCCEGIVFCFHVYRHICFHKVLETSLRYLKMHKGETFYHTICDFNARISFLKVPAFRRVPVLNGKTSPLSNWWVTNLK